MDDKVTDRDLLHILHKGPTLLNPIAKNLKNLRIQATTKLSNVVEKMVPREA